LDSIRATKAFSALRLAPDVKIGMWGYSGGAIAQGWASALQPSYAPELNVVGVAHGGTPVNLTATVEFLEGKLGSGCQCSFCQSRHQLTYSRSSRTVRNGSSISFLCSPLERGRNSSLPLGNRVCKTKMRHRCGSEVSQYRIFRTRGLLYQCGNDLARSSDSRKLLRCFFHLINQSVLDSLVLGEGGAGETPRAPMFVYHARNDQVVSSISPMVLTADSLRSGSANGG